MYREKDIGDNLDPDPFGGNFRPEGLFMSLGG